ncbi:MAG: ABC transporter permease [Cyclobacteriaceae bacterium]
MNVGFKGLILNYIKVGMRSLTRYRYYSVINILGLVIAFSSVFSIIIYLDNQLSYDRYHENGDDIYRVNIFFIQPERDTRYPLIPPAFAPAIVDNFPEAERVARIRYAYNVLIKKEDRSFYEEGVFFAEPEFLEMFTFKSISGDPVKALAEPNSIVLTRSVAEKYFGNENPIGKAVDYNEELTLQVGAVIDDVPDNSHFDFDFLISFETYAPGPGSLADLTSWRWLGFLTYVQLRPDADVSSLEEKLAEIFVSNRSPNAHSEIEIYLQPLHDIYLRSSDISNPMGGLFKINDFTNVISLGVVAALIIIIAFFNYMNITTALMRTRIKEVGVRKVFGSSKFKIIGQMMIETLVVIGVASILSLMALFVVFSLGYLPVFGTSSMLVVLLALVSISTFFSVSSGLYIGIALSGYSAIALLNNRISTKTSVFSFRHGLLFIQYAISSSLIAISLIAMEQIHYFNQKELGYDQDGMLVLPYRGENATSKMEPLRNALLKNSIVQSVSFGPSLDGSTSGSPLRLKEWQPDQNIPTSYFGVDFDFTNLMSLDLLKGRFFEKGVATDSSAILLNETLASALGINEIQGQRVIFAGDQEFEVIGIFSDFHYQSLHHEIGPMALIVSDSPPRNMLIRFSPTNLDDDIASIASDWNSIFPGNEYPFQYTFLEDQLASLYNNEKGFASLIQIFTGLSIFIAVLGLFGLSAITIHLKLKQISIRRVLGAGFTDISKVIGRDFLLIALVASIVIWPLVKFLMDRWLQNFAYSIEPGITFMVQTLIVVSVVTLFTLGIQIVKVIMLNPSKILKSD